MGNSGAIPAIEITKENADHRNDMAYASDDSDYQESTSDRRASNAAPVNNPGSVDTDQGVGSSYHPHPIHHQQQQQQPQQHHHHSARGSSSSAVHIRTDHGQVQHSPGSSSSPHHPQQQQVSDTMMRCHVISVTLWMHKQSHTLSVCPSLSLSVHSLTNPTNCGCFRVPRQISNILTRTLS